MNSRAGIQFGSLAALSLAALALWPEVRPEVVPPAASPAPVVEVGALASAASATAGADAATVPSAERAPACRPPALDVTVVDADSAQPLPGATVAWRAADGGTAGLLVSDRDGHVSLSPMPLGPCAITIRCAAHATLRAILPPGRREAIIAVEGSGGLTVTIRDSDGLPMAGVAIALLPPCRLGGGFRGDFVRFAAAAPVSAEREEGMTLPELVLIDGVYRLPAKPVAADQEWQVGARWHAVPRQQVTGKDGVVSWSALPAGADYRFGLLPPRHGELDPPHELQRLTPSPEGVTVGQAPPQNLSGMFAITRGEVTTVNARVLRTGTVRGRLATPPCTRAPARLFAITQAGGGDTAAVTALDVAGCQQTDDHGAFVFANVRPGDYALRSCWMEGSCDVHFISVTLRVPPGADVDLGALAPTTGHTVVIDVGLAASDGRVLAADAVFAAPASANAVLMLGALPESRTLADALNEVSIVPFATPITFHGLPPGRLHVTARPAEANVTLAAGTQLRASATLEVRLPRVEPVQPRLMVETNHQIAIECRGEDGTPRTPLCLWTRNRADGRVESHRLRSDAASLCLRSGEYDLFLAMLGSGAAQCAVTTLAVPRSAATPLPIVLQAAAAVHGRLVDAAGRPVPGKSLQWTLPGWAGSHGTWLFVATTNAAGVFALEGVPVGVPLHAATGTPALPALASGPNTLVLVSA